MKTMLFTAALLIGGAASAQNMPDTQSGTTTTTTTTTAQSQGTGVTNEGTVPNGVAVPPPGTNVMADTSAGGQVVVAPNQAAPFTPQPATKNYPRCSRAVTDNCVQGGPRRR